MGLACLEAVEKEVNYIIKRFSFGKLAKVKFESLLNRVNIYKGFNEFLEQNLGGAFYLKTEIEEIKNPHCKKIG